MMLTLHSTSINRKQPIEKGPFGKPTNRRSTRSKTATPATREDLVRLENCKAQDDVFSKFKAELDDQQQWQQTQQQSTSRPAPDKIASSALQRPQTDGPASTGIDVSTEATAAASGTLAEPTEVLIYGYSSLHFPAAITFYEIASRGRIYEDYDRTTTAPSSFGLGPPLPALPRSLPRPALKRIREYKGGEHWIKVTFDSPRAADLACEESPHVIGGCMVFAELWRGVGPTEDMPFMAASGAKETARGKGSVRERGTGGRGQAWEGAKDWSSVPTRMHGQPLLFGREGPFTDSISSTETADGSNGNTTSTATGESDGPAVGPSNTNEPEHILRRRQQQHMDPSSLSGDFVPEGRPVQSLIEPLKQPARHPQAALRIPTAKRIVLQPASSALLPVPPWPTRVFGHVPIIGSLFFSAAAPESQSAGGVIGSTVPRDEKGAFDRAHASAWWCFCWWLDQWLGTDLCGLKGED